MGSSKSKIITSAGVLASAAVLALAASAGASTFTFSNPTYTTAPTGATQGLIGSVWHTNGLPSDGGGTQADASNVAAFAQSGSFSYLGNTYTTNGPQYNFLNTNDSLTSTGGGIATHAFIGADASGAAATDSTSWSNSILDYQGYINVTTPGNYTVTLPANGTANDDTTQVFIGDTGTGPSAIGTGTVVAGNNYNNNFGTPGTTNTLDFTTAGLYPVEVFNYQGGGGAALTASITNPSGAAASYLTTNASSVTSTTPPTPTPSSGVASDYNFSSGTTNDSVGGANGTLIGPATISNGNLVTQNNNNVTGGNPNGMRIPLSVIGNIHGSFAIEDFMSYGTTANLTANESSWSTLFSFGRSQNNFIILQAKRQDGTGIMSIGINVGKNPIFLGATPIADTGKHMIALTYNSTTKQVAMYVDGKMTSSGEISIGNLDLGALSTIATPGTGQVANQFDVIGGPDPYNDPSFGGNTSKFKIFSNNLTAGQILSDYNASTTAIPEPATLGLLAVGGVALLRRRRKTA